MVKEREAQVGTLLRDSNYAPVPSSAADRQTEGRGWTLFQHHRVLESDAWSTGSIQGTKREYMIILKKYIRNWYVCLLFRLQIEPEQ